MDKREKLSSMEKMIRELDDIVNSQTSLLKKIAQLEAENINLGNSILEKQLPENFLIPMQYLLMQIVLRFAYTCLLYCLQQVVFMN